MNASLKLLTINISQSTSYFYHFRKVFIIYLYNLFQILVFIENQTESLNLIQLKLKEIF